MESTHYNIFKKGSKTFFYSSLFLPPMIREDVFVLYSFVRKADDFVDMIPQQREEFYAFTGKYGKAMRGEITGDLVVDSFAKLAHRKGFPEEWIEAFLWSMERDMVQVNYRTIDELKEYLYGSAEVIGLMMAKILGLPKESYVAARNQGRAMQYINFIRDIPEDLELGRTYLPQVELEEFHLSGLEYEETARHPDEFRRFIHKQIGRYMKWQRDAERGYGFIKKRFLIAVKTAADMYDWTALQIMRDPFIIYRRKVKPSVPRIITEIVMNTVPRSRIAS